LYTPDDIPPVSPSTSDGSDDAKREKLRLEEKIARDWHRDMTWRKVLVKLEPDAHNNIIVRRMFPNAYGWPVLEHLVKEHFSRDPEGLESAFTQETGVIPLGLETKSWDSSIMDVEEDEESVERAESEGRAGLSDEEGAVEMKEFSVRNGRSSVIPSDPEVVNSALDFHFT
jgi:hypothetical protein